MEKEYERLREAHKQVYALQQELQKVEEKWAAKLEDVVDEIGLLKTRLEERDRDEVAANEKHAALPKECKGRGKEIAAFREQQQQHVKDERLVYLDNQGLPHVAEN